MELWKYENQYLVYQHYEKPMASRQILKSESAQSDKCNTSARLDWSECVAPVLTDYFVRMKQGGYNEVYRKRILEQALRVYDRLIDAEKIGMRPIHRPKDWCVSERRKQKQRKKHGMGTWPQIQNCGEGGNNG